MKNLLFVILCIIMLISCKPSSHIYHLNFVTDSLHTDNKSVRYNKDNVILHIDSINRMIFDINVSGQSIATTLDNNNIFDTLYAQVKPGAISDATKNIANIKSTGHSDMELEINEAVDLLNAHVTYIQSFLAFGKVVPIIISGEPYSQKKIIERTISDFNKRLFIKQINDDETNCPDTISSIAGIQSIVNEYPIKWFHLIESDKRSIQSKINDLSAAGAAANADEKNSITNLTSQVKLVIDEAATVSQDSLQKAVNILTNMLSKVNDIHNFSFISPRYYPDGDFFELGVKITPKEKYKNIYNQDSIFYKTSVKGRFEWAIGPALNFGFGKNNFDYSYSIDSARNPSSVAVPDTFVIKQNNVQNKISPSIGVMAHFYWQQHWPVIPGVSLGISTSTNDLSQVKAYLGTCLVIGGFEKSDNKLNFNKVIFSFGASYGRVARLKEGLQLGNNPKSQIPFTGNSIATDQLTQNVGRIGLYFGLSYKLN